jgi:outer membrane protein assembly factor BamE (lipoprotein component of BamABCDE complex)
MIVILRVALLTALAAASIPAAAPAQGTAIDSLNRRVVLLEGKVAYLEQRVRMLETLVKADSSRNSPVPASANWRDLANWRRLVRGMNMDQVRALLGEPERVEGGPVTSWYWTNANVYFISGQLSGWSEPHQ